MMWSHLIRLDGLNQGNLNHWIRICGLQLVGRFASFGYLHQFFSIYKWAGFSSYDFKRQERELPIHARKRVCQGFNLANIILYTIYIYAYAYLYCMYVFVES